MCYPDIMMIQLNRCFANRPNQNLYADYHDHEWGKPVYDERLLFEMLILEGAQAGLSWETILKKRQCYRQAFFNFDVRAVAQMSDQDLFDRQQSFDIIKHQKKIFSCRTNARVWLDIQNKHGSFSNYIWSYVNGQPIINHWQHANEVPTQTPLSQEISKDLKSLGMSFVGPTIIYAYMQAVGLVDDHLETCWLRTGLTIS